MYVLEQSWALVLLAFAIGAARAILLEGPQAFHPTDALLHRRSPVLLVLALMVSEFTLLPGRSALWLEIGLWLSFAYMCGCYAGYIFHRARRPMGQAPRTGDRRRAPSGARRPPSLFSPDEDDDLVLIEGMDLKTRTRLRALGICRLYQIAGWSPRHAGWIDEEFQDLGDNVSAQWIAQATDLLARHGVLQANDREVA